jgi:hypothetical protein
MAGLDPAATTTVIFKIERNTPEFAKLHATMPALTPDKLLTYTRGLWNLVWKQDAERLSHVLGVFNEAILMTMHDTAGRSILHYAAYLGSLDCMKMLLSVCPRGLLARGEVYVCGCGWLPHNVPTADLSFLRAHGFGVYRHR